MTSTNWNYGHRRVRRRTDNQIAAGWSGGGRDRATGRDRAAVFSLTLRDAGRPDTHGCAERLNIRMSRAEAADLHGSLGRMLAEHTTP